MTNYYQLFTSNNTILESAANEIAQRNPALLRTKPVTGWIRQSQAADKDTIMVWSKEGLKRCLASGLIGWQCAVVQSEILVKEFSITTSPTFKDNHQLLATRDNLQLINSVDLMNFLQQQDFHNIRQKVVVYVTRGDTVASQEVMVFNRNPKTRFEVPCQELQAYEHPCEGSFRSLQEQSGISDQIQFRKLGLAYNYDFQHKAFETLHYFQSPLHSNVPEHWSVANADRSVKEFSWIPLDNAKHTLPSWQAKKLDLVQ